MDLKELGQLRDRAESVWAHTKDPYVEELAAILGDLLNGLIEEKVLGAAPGESEGERP